MGVRWVGDRTGECVGEVGMAGAQPKACGAQIWAAVPLSRRCQDLAESPEWRRQILTSRGPFGSF